MTLQLLPTRAADEPKQRQRTAESINELIKLLDIAATTYTPSVTAAGGGFSLGNGSASGRYRRYGNRVKGGVLITMGSTTSFGSGEYQVSIPFAAIAGEGAQLGSVYMLDAGTANYSGTSYINDSGTYVRMYTHNSGSAVGAASPFTFANGDVIQVEFDYFVA